MKLLPFIGDFFSYQKNFLWKKPVNNTIRKSESQENHNFIQINLENKKGEVLAKIENVCNIVEMFQTARVNKIKYISD